MMDDNDQGHRYGNFPNYYAFHPPTNRLTVLENTNILSYIRDGLLKTSSCDDVKKMIGSDKEAAADEERATKKLRIEETKSQQLPVIYYCDLGCNEGDLTLAMASSLLNKYTSKHDSTRDESVVDKLSSESKVVSSIKVLGLDLDSMLIERANNKLSSSDSIGGDDKSKKVQEGLRFSGIEEATFKVCNLCSESEHNNAYTSYINAQDLQLNGTPASTSTTEEEAKQSTITHTPTQLFHLTSIFSTTMWIHVHSGDDGLKSFLERACSWTKGYLLIEPQPSGCYRKANTRLRKMGRQELDDVTPTRLKMRLYIESAIERVVIGCGFRRINLTKSSTTDDGKGEKDAATTAWNRSLQLYERQEPGNYMN